jgi:hypothetical protein
MDQGERRIRRLKLSSSDDTLLPQARYRLEEAFRTASLPGLPPNAQVLIRRFDLGSMRIDQSSTLLAGKITGLIRNLATAAVCIDHQSADAANVVWFSDPLQPYKVLMSRLLDGNAANEWYWRTLFPTQTLALNSATIEMLLLQSASLPLKGLAPSRLIQCALEARSLMPFFSCITVLLARRMLHEQGLSPVAVVSPPAQTETGSGSQTLAAPNMSLPWRHALQQAVLCWGERDVRCLWLAWHALIFHQPAYLERKETLQRIVPGDWLKSWALNSGSAAVDRKIGIGTAIASDKDAADFKTEVAHLQQPDSSALPETFSSSVQSAAVDAGSVAITQDAGNFVSSSKTLLPSARDAATELSSNVVAQLPKSDTSPTDVIFPAAGVAASFSPHAGFAFVIPQLQRLGMSELLARNDSLVVLDFPRQLLWSMAQRFGMAESDPVWQLFEGFEQSDDVTIEPFCVPANWWRLVTVSGRPLNGLGITGQENSISLHQLINLMQFLGVLYLRRHCGLSLRTLMQRPGRVALTTTHWDVIFDINQTDLRLRRVALDSHPGWVAWLGRVVQFHYDSEGQRYV